MRSERTPGPPEARAGTVAVAEQGSFVAAAAVLKCSQPGLTRTVRRVEDVLGAALFERTTRRVRLTAAGRGFCCKARRLTVLP